MTAADPDLPRLSDVLSIYKQGRASGRQTDWLRLEPEPRWEARPALPAAQSWGQPDEPLHASFPQKSPGQIAGQGVRAAFLSRSLGLGLSWTQKSPGLSRLADVSRVALNELHLFISAAELWASTRQPFSFHFYLKKSFICHRGEPQQSY